MLPFSGLSTIEPSITENTDNRVRKTIGSRNIDIKFSGLRALPNELLNMLTSYLSPGSITAIRETNYNLRVRYDPPPPFNSLSVAEVEIEPAIKAACLFVCQICYRLRPASQFALSMVARDMVDAFTESARDSIRPRS